MGTLFGTDGVRDVANRGLTPELAYRLGRAGAVSLPNDGRHRPVLVVGGDTRRSTGMLEAAVVAGINSAGADALRVGVAPTPAVAYLTVSMEADAGIVISASHNPAEYNGIKFFGPDGFKLPDATEDEIESRVLAGYHGQPGQASISEDDGLARPDGGGVGESREIADAVERYVRFAVGTAKARLDGLRVVLDCANGASSITSPRAFRALGAEVVTVHDSPDGVNINVSCGSTHPDALARAVVQNGADIGFAHDGDADRVIACDADGNLVDGDQIMAMCALHRVAMEELPGLAVVATAYSNLGLTHALRSAGCELVVAKNGDRYVLEEMRKRGLVLGGEQSGHIILLDKTTTGDGLITGIEVAGLVAGSGKPLSALARVMTKLPQVLVNVGVAKKDEFGSSARIGTAIEEAQAALGDSGRIMVRPSGTEPLVRVMGEGADEQRVRALVEGLARVIREELA
ncbi:MAG: phosphoglucosamine mutase [Clostridia bacterium]|nr:phosphoglucosamine mutase [Clostridia bacterium]